MGRSLAWGEVAKGFVGRTLMWGEVARSPEYILGENERNKRKLTMYLLTLSGHNKIELPSVKKFLVILFFNMTCLFTCLRKKKTTNLPCARFPFTSQFRKRR